LKFEIPNAYELQQTLMPGSLTATSGLLLVLAEPAWQSIAD
jgi:hypothetical protein